MVTTRQFSGRLTRRACFLLAIIASGCVDALSPTPVHLEPHGPLTIPASATQSGPAFIWAMIVDASGVCIAGATIYVVSGPYAGQTILQDSNCDAWSYDGGVWFGNLPVGATMTLRASAFGYTSMEKTAVAAASGQAVEFELSPVP